MPGLYFHGFLSRLRLREHKMNAHMFALAIAVFMTGQTPAMAVEKGMVQHGQEMKHEQGFIAIKGIEDDYSVIFHIMRAPLHDGYSRDEYHLMVSIEKDGKPIRKVKVQSTVRHPNGRIDDLTDMVQVGDWYLARYNLSHEQGQHRISVHFRIGSKRYHAHILYPEFVPQ